MIDIDKVASDMKVSYEKSDITMFSSELALPDKSEIIEILNDIRNLFFPAYFDADEIGKDAIQFSKPLIEKIYSKLKTQVELALSFKSKENVKENAEKITDEFVKALPQVHRMLVKDAHATFDGDPAAQSKEEIIFSYPGFYAISIYRVAHLLYLANVPFIPRMMSEHAHGKTGIDINPGATIGEYFFIDHGTGIVIGETTEIGKHVKLYQGVTLGALSPRKGQILSGKKRHPTVMDNVTIYSGASILGGETVIGEGAVIGGNSFITESVSANARVSVKLPELIIK
jgi:serine O-acetyltransferase